MQKLEYHEQIKIVNDYTYLGVNFSASKFRLGRFGIPKTPANLRICVHRNLNSVGDEMDVLFHCELDDE